MAKKIPSMIKSAIGLRRGRNNAAGGANEAQQQQAALSQTTTSQATITPTASGGTNGSTTRSGGTTRFSSTGGEDDDGDDDAFKDGIEEEAAWKTEHAGNLTPSSSAVPPPTTTDRRPSTNSHDAGAVMEQMLNSRRPSKAPVLDTRRSSMSSTVTLRQSNNHPSTTFHANGIYPSAFVVDDGGGGGVVIPPPMASLVSGASAPTNVAFESTDITSSSPFEVDAPEEENNPEDDVDDDVDPVPPESLDADVSYELNVPPLDIIDLPRGGVSIETSAVGHVQFGIPPETIKDSMRLGIPVPSVYVVPVDRFCRDMGPALGVNLAEFEFPAYFNYFVRGKRCTLIVDSHEAEWNIRRVFGETLLGPAKFRIGDDPLTHEEEDFSPDFPREAIPNFQKELMHFRMMPDGKELVLETLLEFRHFETASDTALKDNLGAPPPLGPNEDRAASSGNVDDDEHVSAHGTEGGTRRGAVDTTVSENSNKRTQKQLKYSQIRWIGDVAKIYPSDAKEDDALQNKTKRVEIFKMPSGTDYVLHDIDENNIIVGKARFSGNVRVNELISVIGLDDVKEEEEAPPENYLDDIPEEDTSKRDRSSSIGSAMPPTFSPPSFGLTVLGNSHGFDKSGSTSGYVLWINGRGVMIDPPPYSSATLEREGIRPRTIVGIILTHCHADHDAGAFQKVLAGSPVVVITTPTIYKSFIRKYAALSSLKPAILRQSHRFKPAIIGQPLRFQGATFHFTYTLHSIPCVGFKVEWRGRSMVFTGDHFNNPPALQALVEKGVLSKARCADLNHLPLQETDLLLHESGAPPIHTPLDVLLKLPAAVKRRLFVVHTSALPEGCELKVAPTGTAGTIRLDQIRRSSVVKSRPSIFESSNGGPSRQEPRPSIFEATFTFGFGRNSFADLVLEDVDEYAESELLDYSPNDYKHILGDVPSRVHRRSSTEPPPVSLRPTSSSDAWFILNLLSAVPFLSDLSYSTTMEVLETARVVAFCCNEVVLPASRRSKYLVVVWEGTCMEMLTTERRTGERRRSDSDTSFSRSETSNSYVDRKVKTVWYAGDWTGPRILQPERKLSGDSTTSRTHDIVAMSTEGVKVIVVDFNNLNAILRQGSALYRKYHRSLSESHVCEIPPGISEPTACLFTNAIETLNVIDLLDSNSALRKLSAVQKRHLECLVEGPVVYTPGQRLWRSGSIVDKAFIIVAGTVSFVPKKRKNGGSSGIVKTQRKMKQAHEDAGAGSGKAMKREYSMHSIREMLADITPQDDISQGGESGSFEAFDSSIETAPPSKKNPFTLTDDYHSLSQGLLKLAEHHQSQNAAPLPQRRNSSWSNLSPDVSLHDLCYSDEQERRTDDKKKEKGGTDGAVPTRVAFDISTAIGAAEPSKDRFANRVLGRMYNRRTFASGLVFSRGHFLGDIEKMVEGLLSQSQSVGESDDLDDLGGNESAYETVDDALSLETMTIHELDSTQHTTHTSTLAAGKDGCVVLVLPKARLILFLDQHPGLLLSLLGTQVVV